MASGLCSWSSQYRGRRAVAARFGNVFYLPIVKRASAVLWQHAADGLRVLEVGAGDRRRGAQLRRRFHDLSYESFDIDVDGAHDFHDWSQISGPYDLIFAFEVVEHLSSDELSEWFVQVKSRLAPGGRFLCTTPNIYYPPDYLRDITHRTPLCFDELGGLVQAAGLHVTNLCRVYHDPLHRRVLKRFAFGWLFRMLGIDYARQILLVAIHPPLSEDCIEAEGASPDESIHSSGSPCGKRAA